MSATKTSGFFGWSMERSFQVTGLRFGIAKRTDQTQNVVLWALIVEVRALRSVPIFFGHGRQAMIERLNGVLELAVSQLRPRSYALDQRKLDLIIYALTAPGQSSYLVDNQWSSLFEAWLWRLLDGDERWLDMVCKRNSMVTGPRTALEILGYDPLEQ